MKVTGLITEYNPFHNGHLYHIQKSKEYTDADYIIVVMSGDYVQRGTPAVIDKYLRAQMALEAGADLVLLLPVAYSCASAEYFAIGAVSLLDKLGIVNSICFGSESGNLTTLFQIASYLAEESLEFKENLGKKFAVEVVAFANSIGGKILIGVDDDGNIIGTDTSNNQRANIQNQISQIEPRINVKIEVVDNVIVVNVPEGDDKPYSSSEGYYLRAGAMCQKMNRNEIREYLEDGGKIQFDRMINKKAKYPEDFDENAYKNFLKLSNTSETIEREELLINLNCLEKVDNKCLQMQVLFSLQRILQIS